jgi:NAD(P)-dependent dehydrogenase (short-subunit alcohol dehydrogenase family)
MRLDGKVAVITGGASGMGKATASLFVAEGARVVIGDVQAEAVRAVAESLGRECVAVRADVTSGEDVAGLIRTAVERFGKLDVVFNNAGGVLREADGARRATAEADGARRRLADMSEDQWNGMIALNLTSAWLGMKHALPCQKLRQPRARPARRT